MQVIDHGDEIEYRQAGLASNRCRIRWQIRAFKSKGPNARMLIERSARRAENFLFNDVEIDLGIWFGEHPVPLRTLFETQDMQAIRACNADRGQVLRAQSPRVGSDDTNFVLQAANPPCQGHLQETRRKYRHANGFDQFPLEDGIESTTRGDGLDTLRYHRPGVGDHRTEHGLIRVFKYRVNIGTTHGMEPDRVTIRRGIGAVATQEFKLLQAPGHLPCFPAQDADLCGLGFIDHDSVQQARSFSIVRQLRTCRFDRVTGQRDLDGH